MKYKISKICPQNTIDGAIIEGLKIEFMQPEDESKYFALIKTLKLTHAFIQNECGYKVPEAVYCHIIDAVLCLEDKK